jgi:hypothetical protein
VAYVVRTRAVRALMTATPSPSASAAYTVAPSGLTRSPDGPASPSIVRAFVPSAAVTAMDVEPGPPLTKTLPPAAATSHAEAIGRGTAVSAARAAGAAAAAGTVATISVAARARAAVRYMAGVSSWSGPAVVRSLRHAADLRLRCDCRRLPSRCRPAAGRLPARARREADTAVRRWTRRRRGRTVMG